LLQNIKGENYTIEEYKEKVSVLQSDKENKVVFLYSTILRHKTHLSKTIEKRGYDILKLNGVLDGHFTFDSRE
jgi:molecular chaperone HtpG